MFSVHCNGMNKIVSSNLIRHFYIVEDNYVHIYDEVVIYLVLVGFAKET